MAEEKGEQKEKSLLEQFGFEEEKYEAVRGEEKPEQLFKTTYPKPTHRLRLTFESYQMSVEENYYFILGALREMGYLDIDKIYDIMTSGEQSAIWGQQQSRLSTQQSYVSNYMQTIGKLIRELVQLVHDLRVLDEKLRYFDEADKKDKDDNPTPTISAWVTLKSRWVEFVEGGVNNPSSVMGLAQKVGFVTLPDLFFSTLILKVEDIDKIVDPMPWNPKVKEVLKRKMFEFLTWKESNAKETRARRTYLIKFFRQHYNVIRMYINWTKPYLRNVARLQSKDSRSMSPDIVAAFENSVVDLEFLAKKRLGKKYQSCVLVTFEFFTKPELMFRQPENYQDKGAIHVGRIEVTMRHYVWDEEQVKKYKGYRDKADFSLIADVDSSLRDAMEALGEDVDIYLRELGEVVPERQSAADAKKAALEQKKLEREMLGGALDPFKSIFIGFKDIFDAFFPSKSKEEKSEEAAKAAEENEKKDVQKNGSGNMSKLYMGYKRAHGFLTW